MAFDNMGRYTPDASMFTQGTGMNWGTGGQQFGATPSNFGQVGFQPNQNAGDFFSSGQAAGLQQAPVQQSFNQLANQNNTDTSNGFFSNFGGESGWGNQAIGGLGALAGAWQGIQGVGIAKDQLAQNSNQFERNFAEQRANIAQNRADSQAARDAARGL